MHSSFSLDITCALQFAAAPSPHCLLLPHTEAKHQVTA